MVMGNARRAYHAAGYKARMPVNLRDSSAADVCASNLLRLPKVQSRLEILKAMAMKRADITEDTIATKLEEAFQVAKGEHQGAAMVSAATAMAKLAGLMIDRKEIGDPYDFSRMTEDELRNEIAKLEGKDQHPPAPTNEGPETRQ